MTMYESKLRKRFGPVWNRGVVCVYAQVVASNEVLPNLYVSAETLKAGALIGLHLLAAEYEMGSSG